MRAQLAVLGQHGEEPGVLVRREGAVAEDVHLPGVARIEPPVMPKVVVLPAPLGPMKPQITPLGTLRSSPSRATVRP